MLAPTQGQGNVPTVFCSPQWAEAICPPKTASACHKWRREGVLPGSMSTVTAHRFSICWRESRISPTNSVNRSFLDVVTRGSHFITQSATTRDLSAHRNGPAIVQRLARLRPYQGDKTQLSWRRVQNGNRALKMTNLANYGGPLCGTKLRLAFRRTLSIWYNRPAQSGHRPTTPLCQNGLKTDNKRSRTSTKKKRGSSPAAPCKVCLCVARPSPACPFRGQGPASFSVTFQTRGLRFDESARG
ncbi:hypothetical protein DFP92_101395 [Yoonia sediminilitoris]|uniref:Uncharacterized protein n=1 Tax=Yoonia sediminilitoris TaxID=1286148 RepID=A0A2T6KQH1_9RHOB|nr:hypothetical protein C8N45_101395 [Yoonia sediminilitoris]RCW98974.1 hypothetical protein DFP92_101395 [Yoonia sediminilitoris]